MCRNKWRHNSKPGYSLSFILTDLSDYYKFQRLDFTTRMPNFRLLAQRSSFVAFRPFRDCLFISAIQRLGNNKSEE
jgi:hypothetical protein